MGRQDRLELWGGLEATIVRVGERFRDQASETGHRDRLDDLDRIAALGIRTLRYPFLWESIAPDHPDCCDWHWHDLRAERLRRLGIRPVAGLVHHGSGPAYTSLVDPAFPELLARHAAQVARRYPWIDLYTPVNEPLTTARFSCLYGHWYPHERSEAAFFRALVNQCRATLLAMREIRRVNPDAALVQTEDLGKTFSTPALADQAELENQRRWLSFDLLFGRLDREHPWWPVLLANGISERELDELAEGEARPDVVGINHYLTSERYLDERLTRYPEHLWGGNGGSSYADVEAVRIRALDGETGSAPRLREAWERYRAPIAVTEAHHGCSRDEQVRWLLDVWRAAETVRSEGADIRAVTVWSLFGAVDWNSLLTREAGFYEPGPFDVRAPSPRPTALAVAATALATTGAFDHPVLDSPGWWRRETRFYKPAVIRRERAANAPRCVLILGDGGPVQDAMSRIACERGLAHSMVGPADGPRLEAAAEPPPWAILDLAGLAPRHGSVAHTVPDLAWRARHSGARFVTVSGTGLFSGRLGRAYGEADPADAADPVGRRALARERQIRRLNPNALAIRTGPLFGPWHQENPVFDAMLSLSSGRPVAWTAEIVSPTYLPDLAHTLFDLLIDGDEGIRHLANAGAASWAEIAGHLAARAGLALPPLREAPPLRDVSLVTACGPIMPSLDSALDRFVRDCEPDWRVPDQPLRLAAG